MKNKKVWLIFLILLLVLVSCSKQNSVLIDNGNEKIKINVEIADDEIEMQQGLMFRESLEESSGMIFVFEKKGMYGFWMKNTLIPLDVIFIDDNLHITGIIYAEPCKEDPCRVYRPENQFKYVLEVNGNFTSRNNISLGNKVELII